MRTAAIGLTTILVLASGSFGPGAKVPFPARRSVKQLHTKKVMQTHQPEETSSSSSPRMECIYKTSFSSLRLCFINLYIRFFDFSSLDSSNNILVLRNGNIIALEFRDQERHFSVNASLNSSDRLVMVGVHFFPHICNTFVTLENRL